MIAFDGHAGTGESLPGPADLSATTSLGFTEAMARVREELAGGGFGVLCEIDVPATLTQKLHVDGEPYLVLGSSNPSSPLGAPQAEPELGVLLHLQRRRLQAPEPDPHRRCQRRADAVDRRQRRARRGRRRGARATCPGRRTSRIGLIAHGWTAAAGIAATPPANSSGR